MTLVLKLLFIISISIINTSCSYSTDKYGGIYDATNELNNNKGNAIGNEKPNCNENGDSNMNKNSQILYDLFNEDKYGDRKSVSWDGSSAEIVDDDSDRTDIDDGFRAFSYVRRFEVKDLFELTHPDGNENMELKKVSDFEFELDDNIGIVRVGLVEYNDEVSKLRGMRDSVEIGSEFLLEEKRETINDSTCFVFIDNEGKAGYEFIFTSKKNGLTYKISYAGIGNFTWVTRDFRYLVNHLYIPIPPALRNNGDL